VILSILLTALFSFAAIRRRSIKQDENSTETTLYTHIYVPFDRPFSISVLKNT